VGGIVFAAAWVGIGAVLVANAARTRWWWVPGAASLAVALIAFGLYAVNRGGDDPSLLGVLFEILGTFVEAAVLALAYACAVSGVALLAAGYVLRRRHLRRNAASSPSPT
jgi:hypothetical protein